MNKPKPSLKTVFWYPLETKEAAKFARMPAFIFSVFGAAIGSIIAIVGIFSPSVYGKGSISFAFLFILISLEFFRMHREEFIAGFVVSFAGLLFHTGSAKAISDTFLIH